INIGKNKDTPNERAVDDYLLCLERVYAHAGYITVNISSPNTQGLRERQEQLGSQSGARKPMLLKIAPDLSEHEQDGIAEALLASGIDGVICTNTTVDRALVADDPRGNEVGGLSGKPLFALSSDVLRGMRRRLGERVPIVGV